MRGRGWLAACALAQLALALAPRVAAGEDRPAILIEDPRGKTFRVAVQRFHLDSSDAEGPAGTVRAGLDAGLDFSGLFTLVDERAFLDPVYGPPLEDEPPPDCANWRQIDTDALLRADVARSGGELRLQVALYDVARGCTSLLRKRYRASPNDARRIGKAIADDVVGAITGQPGVADTEIAYVSDRSGTKEIWVMDADGDNSRAATSNRSINAFPDWIPDGSGVLYTSYRYRARPWLFIVTRGTGSPGRILQNLDGGGSIYRGVFDPTGKRIAFVRNVDGQSEIFSVNRDGTGLRRLTTSRAIDVSPTWSPDASQIAFVSDRSGSPQVYVMSADGGEPRRLTFDGSYNTAPAWSPDGRWIAYEVRVNGQFDIWRIDPEGRSNAPVVTHERSDEQPSWSPDSRKLAFSSKRRGKSDIYVIDLGSSLPPRRVTSEGENKSPAWGPYRR